MVAAVLKIDTWRVADVKYEPTEGDSGCLTYHFVLIGKCKSMLEDFLCVVVVEFCKLEMTTRTLTSLYFAETWLMKLFYSFSCFPRFIVFYCEYFSTCVKLLR